MATLLHIDSSPMGDYSVTRALTAAFTEAWKEANAGGVVISRDLTTSGLASVSGAWVGAAYTPTEGRTEEQKAVLAQSDELLAELRAAEHIVLGVPMHNFGVPSVMKQWIDLIARVNETFSYATGAPKGLLTGKKATVLIASGGAYDLNTAMAGLNFVEPYLKVVLGFLGITDVTFYTAGGAAALMQGANREEFFAPHLATVKGLA